MIQKSPQKAVIFDMDGVLVFTEHIRFNVLKNIFINRGIELTQHHFKSFIGRKTKEVISMMVKDVLAIEEIFEEYQLTKPKNVAEYAKPVPLTVDYIKTYTGKVPFAIASNSPRHMIESITKHFGIFTKFMVITSLDDVTHHKPNPEVYVKTSQRLAVNPEECMVIEDSLIGAEAAISAGMHCFILLNGFNNKEEFIEMDVRGFIEITEDLRKVVE